MMNTSLTSSNRICEKIFTDIITISLTLYKFFQTHQKSAYVLEVLNGLKSASLGLIISAAVTIILLALYGNDQSEMNFLSINWTAVFIFSYAVHIA